MRYRRRRKRRYNRSYKRGYRRRKRYTLLKAQRARPEVKVWDATVNGFGVYADTQNDRSLNQVVYQNILKSIIQGNNSFNRVGNRIFVKGIEIRMTYWTCGFTYRVSGTDYSNAVNTGILRVILCDGNVLPLQEIFGTVSAGNKVSSALQRKNHNVYLDRLFRLQGGLGNLPGGIATTASTGSGDIRYKRLYIPINRNVQYNQTTAASTSTDVKDCTDIYSLYYVAAIPNVASFPVNASNTVPVIPICTNTSIRVYFTDS